MSLLQHNKIEPTQFVRRKQTVSYYVVVMGTSGGSTLVELYRPRSGCKEREVLTRAGSTRHQGVFDSEDMEY